MSELETKLVRPVVSEGRARATREQLETTRRARLEEVPGGLVLHSPLAGVERWRLVSGRGAKAVYEREA